MHLAMIIDEERLKHEQSMLNRLSIGLMAEGMQLTRIVPGALDPDTIDLGEQRVALATRLVTPMRVLPWMRQARANRLAEALDKSPPDVIYAVGSKAWAVGLDLAQVIDRPMIVDVCSLAQASLLSRAPKSELIAGYVTPCAPLMNMLQPHVEPTRVNFVPIGIAAPPQPVSILRQLGQNIAIAVIGQARDIQAYAALFSGIRLAGLDLPIMQIMLELDGVHEHEIWKRVHAVGLLDRVSAIGDAPTYRALLTQCDVMLIPEGLGEPRSIMLEAMAFGIPVIAALDPANDVLIDGETALLVERSNARQWSDRIRDILNRPEEARKLGQRARSRVLERNRSSEQVSRLGVVFEQVLQSTGLRLNSGQE